MQHEFSGAFPQVLILIPIIISIGFFVMVAFIVWAGAQSRQRRAQAQADVQTKLIDKFGSASEFVQFLQSPAGRQFLQGTSGGPTRDRILWGLRAGIVMTFLALGFVTLAFMSDRDFIIPGFILLALGIGFFAAAAISMKLSKQWDRNESPDRQP